MFIKILLGVVLAISVLFSTLPKKVLADKYMLQAKHSMEAKDYKSAQNYFEKVLSLGVDVPNTLHYFYAEALFLNKNYKKALEELEFFINGGGDKSKYYTKSLELYAKAEKTQKAKKDKWIFPSRSACEDNGGKFSGGVCIANWQKAKKICSASGGELANIDELKDLVTSCEGSVADYATDNRNQYRKKMKENFKNKNYQKCYEQIGVTGRTYWSGSESLGYAFYDPHPWIINFFGGFINKKSASKPYTVFCVKN